MHENEAEFQPSATDGEPNGTAPWSANGSEPVASGQDGDAEAAADGPTAAEDDAPVAAPSSAADADGGDFLADLARAMQSTAGAEHIRVSEDTERRRGAHLDQVRGRETAEADELRGAAEHDVKGIDSWADAEIERIQRERERRILARRRDLESSLDDHRSLVAREIEAIEAAVLAYRAEIESYFSRLDAETDPVAIAREARSRPSFPDLAAIGPNDAPAQAEATSADETTTDEPAPPTGESTPGPTDSVDGASLVGVMAESSEVATADAPAAEIAADADPETTTPGSAVTARSSAALLQAVPSHRPLGSWFRRDGDAQDRTEDS